MKTRIEFNEEEMEVLVSWIFMDDAKPDKDFKQDVSAIKKSKKKVKTLRGYMLGK